MVAQPHFGKHTLPARHQRHQDGARRRDSAGRMRGEVLHRAGLGCTQFEQALPVVLLGEVLPQSLGQSPRAKPVEVVIVSSSTYEELEKISAQ